VFVLLCFKTIKAKWKIINLCLAEDVNVSVNRECIQRIVTKATNALLVKILKKVQFDARFPNISKNYNSTPCFRKKHPLILLAIS